MQNNLITIREYAISTANKLKIAGISTKKFWKSDMCIAQGWPLDYEFEYELDEYLETMGRTTNEYHRYYLLQNGNLVDIIGRLVIVNDGERHYIHETLVKPLEEEELLRMDYEVERREIYKMNYFESGHFLTGWEDYAEKTAKNKFDGCVKKLTLLQKNIECSRKTKNDLR